MNRDRAHFRRADGPTHVLARGGARCTDSLFDFEHRGTHALYSRFSWEAGQ